MPAGESLERDQSTDNSSCRPVDSCPRRSGQLRPVTPISDNRRFGHSQYFVPVKKRPGFSEISLTVLAEKKNSQPGAWQIC